MMEGNKDFQSCSFRKHMANFRGQPFMRYSKGKRHYRSHRKQQNTQVANASFLMSWYLISQMMNSKTLIMVNSKKNLTQKYHLYFGIKMSFFYKDESMIFFPDISLADHNLQKTSVTYKITTQYKSALKGLLIDTRVLIFSIPHVMSVFLDERPMWLL